MPADRTAPITDWVPVTGLWRFEQDEAVYESPDPTGDHPQGIALGRPVLAQGMIHVSVQLAGEGSGDVGSSTGKVLLGYRSPDQTYYAVGLGGYGAAYGVTEFLPEQGWYGRAVIGSQRMLTPGRWYQLGVQVQGSVIRLSVDGAQVTETILPEPVREGQVGLQTWGYDPVRFRDFVVRPRHGEVFVVMEFNEHNERLHNDIIRPTALELSLDSYHGLDLMGPGRVLDDVATRIQRATVVIAEITAANENVFYEIGYAHALGKPTVLLAERSRQPPFDVADQRCLFYEGSDEGWVHLRRELHAHLQAALAAQPTRDA